MLTILTSSPSWLSYPQNILSHPWAEVQPQQPLPLLKVTKIFPIWGRGLFWTFNSTSKIRPHDHNPVSQLLRRIQSFLISMPSRTTHHPSVVEITYKCCIFHQTRMRNCFEKSFISLNLVHNRIKNLRSSEETFSDWRWNKLEADSFKSNSSRPQTL